MKIHSVAVCLADLAYGGPEEGGWYYSIGEPASGYEQFIRTFRSEIDAYAYKNRLQRKLADKLNQGRRPISSVLSEGEFRAVVFEGLPQAWPQEHPHYE